MDMRDATTTATTARLVRHEYSSGRAFWTVECQSCLVSLNSGHHYQEPNLPHAEALAARHNREQHSTGYIVSRNGRAIGRGFYGENPDRWWVDPAGPDARTFATEEAAERFAQGVGDHSWGLVVEQR